MAPEIARDVLRIQFSDENKARMHELSSKIQQGELAPHEQEELDNFIKVGDLVAILQSKARKLLKVAPPPNRHG